MKIKKKKSFLSMMVVLGFMSFVPVTLSAFGSVEENGDYTQSMNEGFTASIDKIDMDLSYADVYVGASLILKKV